jgi:hypothetical protein
LGALGDPGDVRVSKRGGLGVQHLGGIGPERSEHVGGVAEHDHGVLLHGVGRRQGDADDHRLGAAQRGVEGLDSDGHRALVDHLDRLVGQQLLGAGRPLLVGRLDEALLEHDRMAVDAVELGVDVLDRGLRARGRQRSDLLGAALLVDPADGDRRQ